MTRHNIRHGRRRRMPWSVRAPVIILMVELVALIVLLPVLVLAVIER